MFYVYTVKNRKWFRKKLKRRCTLKNTCIILQIKTDILIIQKRFISMFKVACKLPNTRLVCNCQNRHCPVYFDNNNLNWINLEKKLSNNTEIHCFKYKLHIITHISIIVLLICLCSSLFLRIFLRNTQNAQIFLYIT